MIHGPGLFPLAKGADDLWQIIPLLIFVVIGVIGGIAKKAMARREEQQRRQLPREEPVGPQETAQPQEREVASRPPAIGQIPRQGQAVGTPLEPTYSRLRRPQPVAVAVGREAPPAPQEARRLQQQRMLQRGVRVQTHQQPMVAPLAEPVAAHHRVAEAQEPVASGVPVVLAGLNLKDAQELRRAIVCHEIFARPLALRVGPQMWDL